MLTADIGADALLDLDLQFEWYADVADEDVAGRYLAAFHESKEQLCRLPDLGRIRRFQHRRLAKLFSPSRIVSKAPHFLPRRGRHADRFPRAARRA